MVELRQLSGRKAGSIYRARLFPFYVGRGSICDAVVDEAGVWERHFSISSVPDGFLLRTDPQAFVSVNGKTCQECRLGTGDVLEMGGCKLQFAFSATRQRNFRLREALTWVALALLSVAQIALIYLLS